MSAPWRVFGAKRANVLIHRANAYPTMRALLRRVLNTPLGTLGDCDEWDAPMHEIDAALAATEDPS